MAKIPVMNIIKRKPRCPHTNVVMTAFNRIEADFKCEECGKHFNRKLTEKEQKLWDERQQRMDKRSQDLHTLIGDFYSRFRDGDGWVCTGYELIEKIDAWASDYPQVLKAYCDDDMFMSSTMYFIPHTADGYVMGYTALYVPQDTGSEIAHMFLYENHVRSMVKAATEMDRVCKSSVEPDQDFNLPFEPNDD